MKRYIIPALLLLPLEVYGIYMGLQRTGSVSGDALIIPAAVLLVCVTQLRRSLKEIAKYDTCRSRDAFHGMPVRDKGRGASKMRKEGGSGGEI